MALITCEKATFAYEGHVVVDSLTLTVERGEYLCILGENGSGKSTLVKGLLGLLAPVKGRIVYGDGLKHNEIGYLPQRSELQNDFPASVWEVVTSGVRGKWPILSASQKKLALDQIQLLGMDGFLKKRFMELSGGQQQRTLLARALCATGSMLLLDEPVAGLDPLVTKEMYGVIEMLHQQRGLTIVMISHDVQAALHYADRVLHMSHGRTFLGTVAEYQNSSLGALFAGEETYA
ncbi:MAG: metal ABC transporter ATP-binding protein [Clostridia bacterium]